MVPAERVRTLGEAVNAAAARLAAAGIEAPRREARLLVALAAQCDQALVLGYPERPLEAAARLRLAGLLARRAAREPMARLMGRREFWSLDFALAPETLEPRPDSETLIEAALALIGDRAAPLRLLDLGTGSGCLLLALLSELPRAVGFGIDIAAGAVAAARRNAAALGLDSRAAFVVGDWGEAVTGAVDVMLVNPPYIPSGSIAALQPEVALFEPRAALDGGADGLGAYAPAARAARRLLTPAGFACCEIGAGQAAAAAAIFAAEGLDVAAVRRDLQGQERCLVVQKSKPRTGDDGTKEQPKKLLDWSHFPSRVVTI